MPVSTDVNRPRPGVDVASAPRRVGAANGRRRTRTRRRSDWPRRLHRLLAVLWVPPAPLSGRRMVPRAEPPEDVSRGEYLQSLRRAISDSDRAPDGRVAQAKRAARSYARRRQEHRSLELRRRPHRRQPRRRGRARHAGGTATYFMSRTGHDDPWFVALVGRAADRYVSTQHHGVGVRPREAAGRSALSHGPDRHARYRPAESSSTSAAVRDSCWRCSPSAARRGAPAPGRRPGRLPRCSTSSSASKRGLGSQRSPDRRSARPRRSSKEMRARTCRVARAWCSSSTSFT